MKNIFLRFIKYVIAFAIVITIFNICLFLACSFDSSAVEKKATESYEILNEQGMFYNLSDEFEITNNNCTDAVIINEAYAIDSRTPYISYMKARKNYQEGLTLEELPEATGEGISVNYYPDTDMEIYEYGYDSIGELGDFLAKRIHYSINYGRYWHGYLVLYRPLLTIFNISQIRTFLLVTYIALLALFVYLLNKRFGKICAIIFGASLICSGYLSASFSLESSPVFLVTMISSIIFLKRIDKIKNVGIFFFVTGCFVNYVDYLTVPVISLGVLSCLNLLKLIEDGKDWKECLKSLIINSIIWGLGYACSWITKWVLYDLTINDVNNMIKIGFTQSFFRMQRGNVITHASLFNIMYEIISKSSLYIVITTIVMLIVNKFKVASNKFNKLAIPFSILALYPIVWLILLANHTLIHSYFTYRQILVFMMGILLAFYVAIFKKEKKKR